MNQPTYTPEPITTVNEGETIPVKASESLAMEYINFAVDASRFLMRYKDFINRFMEEVTDEIFQQMEELMKNLDPTDPVTVGVAESIEQAKMLHHIHKERIQRTEETA